MQVKDTLGKDIGKVKEVTKVGIITIGLGAVRVRVDIR